MSTVYGTFTSTATLRSQAGDAKYAGLAPMGDATVHSVRRCGRKLVRVGDDMVERQVYWLMPGVEVRPGDIIDNAEVREVQEARNETGLTLYTVAYADA